MSAAEVNSSGPKVFVSYSWSSEDHKTWVIDLAERLLSDGIDVVIDEWDWEEGQDKYQFMERMVNDLTVTKVLVVSDKRYAEKANDRAGGVGTEGMIISPKLYNDPKQNRFLPLVTQRDENGKEYLPTFMESRKYFDFSSVDLFEDSYERLRRNIYGKPERPKPPIGKMPAHLAEGSPAHSRLTGKLETLKLLVQKGRPSTPALDDYLEAFASAFDDFQIVFDPQLGHHIDDLVLASIEKFTPYRDNFVSFLQFVSNHLDQSQTYDAVIVFLEGLLPRQYSQGQSYYNAQFDGYKFMLYELFLYSIATLIKSKKYDAVARLIENTYTFPRGTEHSEYITSGPDAFNKSVDVLDVHRNRRLKLNKLSVTSGILKERCTSLFLKWIDIVQADILIFMRPMFPSAPIRYRWYPRCVLLAPYNATLELFGKAPSSIGFAALRTLLKIQTRKELAEHLEAFLESDAIQSLTRSNNWFYVDVNLEQLLNLSQLNTQAVSRL